MGPERDRRWVAGAAIGSAAEPGAAAVWAAPYRPVESTSVYAADRAAWAVSWEARVKAREARATVWAAASSNSRSRRSATRYAPRRRPWVDLGLALGGVLSSVGSSWAQTKAGADCGRHRALSPTPKRVPVAYQRDTPVLSAPTTPASGRHAAPAWGQLEAPPSRRHAAPTSHRPAGPASHRPGAPTSHRQEERVSRRWERRWIGVFAITATASIIVSLVLLHSSRPASGTTAAPNQLTACQTVKRCLAGAAGNSTTANSSPLTQPSPEASANDDAVYLSTTRRADSAADSEPTRASGDAFDGAKPARSGSWAAWTRTRAGREIARGWRGGFGRRG